MLLNMVQGSFARGLLVLVLAGTFLPTVIPPPAARAGGLTDDIDLTRRPSFHGPVVLQSQIDPRWHDIKIGAGEAVPMGQCGCLLTVFAMLADYYLRGSAPHFATTGLKDPTDPSKTVSSNSFNPIYIHRYLRQHPSGTRPLDWGYQAKSNVACGTNIKPWALEELALPSVVENGLVTSTGFTVKQSDGSLSSLRPTIDRLLQQGKPVPVGLETSTGSGHLMLIVGWDATKQQYLILDPAWDPAAEHLGRAPGARSGLLFDQLVYAKWESSVRAIFETKEAYGASNYIVIGDDPAPIEMLSINPDGYRSGFDPAGGFLTEDAAASLYQPGPWTDPLGLIPPGDRAKFLQIRNPLAGMYRLQVTGTGDGPFAYAISTVTKGHEVVLRAESGTIGRGQTRKYELRYAPGGSMLTPVDAFAPEAKAGNNRTVAPGVPLTFDGSRSFDADGQIGSYAWDFGDGTSGAGLRAMHTYAVPGTYTEAQVKLT